MLGWGFWGLYPELICVVSRQLTKHNKMKNTKLFIISIFITFLLFSCKGNFNTDSKQPKISGTEYRVFTFNTNEKYPIFKNAKPTTLSKEEIIEIEKIVGPKISEIITNHNIKRKKADTYVRQYVAAINENGEKEVWLNIFCIDVNNTEWKKGIIDVADGGACAFNLKANLIKKTFYDLRINFAS